MTAPFPMTDATIILDTEHLTDAGNDRRFVALWGEVSRFCPPWGCWLWWDGCRWAADRDGVAIRRAKGTMTRLYRDAAAAPDEVRGKLIAHALKSEHEARLRAMVSLAESESGIPVQPAELDADPWLLNCANGVLDLRLGVLSEHRPDALHSKLAPVPYTPGATSPAWERFLERIFSGDQDVIGFVQRAIGYTLTGSVEEQCLFLCYGTGSNGKSTFLELLRRLFADYSAAASFDTFLQRDGQTIPNDVARLQGARLVTAVEAGAGRRLNEGLVKQLTGGDTITARFLHREFFEFRPAFKLWLAANHKPTIYGTDHAIWRRIRLIPFTVTIPEAEQDKRLVDTLTAELPGILAWAIRGCRDWRQGGLAAPAAVTQATADYRAEQDVLAEFLDECCQIDTTATCTLKELYVAYTAWSERNGESHKGLLGKQTFNARIEERGFLKDKVGGVGWFWRGLSVTK